MVLLDESKELPDLIRLRLASDRLHVELRAELMVTIDVVASANSVQLEAAGLHQSLEVSKCDVAQRAALESVQEALRIHARTLRGTSDSTEFQCPSQALPGTSTIAPGKESSLVCAASALHRSSSKRHNAG